MQRIHAFDFYSAVRLLAAAGYRLGERLFVQPREGLHGGVTDLERIEIRDPGDRALGAPPPRPAVLLVNFMGLYGVSSMLPNYFNELIEVEPPGEEVLAPFLAVLNDRIYTLLYDTWALPRLLDVDPQIVEDFRTALLSLAGLEVERARRDLLVSTVAYFAQPTRSPWGLLALTRTVFGFAASIEENVPREIELDPAHCSRLSGEYGRMGVNLMLGAQSWSWSSRYRLRIGPLRPEDFVRFLPGGVDHELLLDLIRLYTPLHLEAVVALELAPEDVPRLVWRLGDNRCRLGMSSLPAPEAREEPLMAEVVVGRGGDGP